MFRPNILRAAMYQICMESTGRKWNRKFIILIYCGGWYFIMRKKTHDARQWNETAPKNSFQIQFGSVDIRLCRCGDLAGIRHILITSLASASTILNTGHTTASTGHTGHTTASTGNTTASTLQKPHWDIIAASIFNIAPTHYSSGLLVCVHMCVTIDHLHDPYQMWSHDQPQNWPHNRAHESEKFCTLVMCF